MARDARKPPIHSRVNSLMANRYCDTCNREFSRPSELKRHLKNTLIHNPGARKFKCRYCGALHTQKCNLKTHERTHLERRHYCGLPMDEARRLPECFFKCSDPSSMVRHIGNIHLSKYLDNGLAVPDWLAQALRDKETAADYAQEAGPSSSTSTPSRPPSELSGSSPPTPSPSSGVLFEPQPPQHRVLEYFSEIPDMTRMSIAGGMPTTFGLPGQPDPVVVVPTRRPTPRHVDLGLNLANFSDSYGQVPMFPQAEQTTTAAVPFQTSNDGFYQDSSSNFHLEFSASFSQQPHHLPRYEDLVALTDPFFSDTVAPVGVPSGDFALFTTDSAIRNNQFPVPDDTSGGSSLDLFSAGEQVHLNFHTFF